MSTLPTTVAELHQHLRERAHQALSTLGVEAPSIDLAPPPDPAMGDLCFPCFSLAKALRKAPPLIAQEVAAQIQPDELIAEVTTDKAYVNLRLNQAALMQVVLAQILREQDRYGAGQADPPQHWMVEYSAPNTNKPLHLGHLRNNMLGWSVSCLLEFFGHKVTRINLVNDRGVHICKSMLAYHKWGEGKTPEGTGKKGDHLVGEFYVLFDQRFSEEYEAWKGTPEAKEKLEEFLASKAGQRAAAAHAKTPDKSPEPQKAFFNKYKDKYFNSGSPLGAEVRELLRLWEEENPAVRERWQTLNSWVLAGFDKSYARMGVRFDHIQYESQTYKQGKALVDQGLDQGVLHRLEDGAVVCDLEQVKLKGQKVLLRSDGTSVYMTQDLGTAVERFDRFNVDRMVYVVGDEQLYHFDVLFRVLGLLRPGMTEACHHLAYGMIRLPEGKMKSREGTVVDADDLMDEVHRLAAAETRARAAEGKAHTEGIDDKELSHRAEHIAMSALKYFLLKFSPRKSFEYNPKESIDFLGQTGPYCLFNYARTRSLLRKAGGEPEFDGAAAARLSTDRERELLGLLMSYPKVVAQAAGGLDPSRVAEYLFELSKSFAFIFTDKTNHPIATCEDQTLRQGRLMLVAAISHTLKSGLTLLGIEPLDEM